MTRKEELRLQRAEIIIQQIRTRQRNSTSDGLSIGKLLVEFKVKRLYTVYNYSSLKSWLLHSDVGLPLAVAEKLMAIVSRAESLGLDLEAYDSLGLARLAIIFSLHPNKHAEKIVELLDWATKKSLEELKSAVRNHTMGNQADDKVYTLRFRVSEDVFDEIVRIKRETNLPTFEALKIFFNEGNDDVESGEVAAEVGRNSTEANEGATTTRTISSAAVADSCFQSL